MKADQMTTGDRTCFLEDLAAELTNAAYPVMLRHGVGEKWLDLELALWKAMTDSIKEFEPEILHDLSKPSEPPQVAEC